MGDADVEDHGAGDTGVEDGITGLPRWCGTHGDVGVKEEEGARAMDGGARGGGAPTATRKWMARASNDLEKFQSAPPAYILMAHHYQF